MGFKFKSEEIVLLSLGSVGDRQSGLWGTCKLAKIS
jgi:hypothetical protein